MEDSNSEGEEPHENIKPDLQKYNFTLRMGSILKPDG